MMVLRKIEKDLRNSDLIVQPQSVRT